MMYLKILFFVKVSRYQNLFLQKLNAGELPDHTLAKTDISLSVFLYSVQ